MQHFSQTSRLWRNAFFMNNTLSWLGISLLMLVLSIVGCKPEGLNPTNCRDGKCTYTFEANKAIKIVPDTSFDATFIEIESGDMRVFHYQYIANDQANIADDEYSENIYFEIDPSLENFSFQDAQLADVNLIVQPVCFCLPVIYQPLKGSLSGERKSDDTWKVNLDVEYDDGYSTQSLSFIARFEEK